MYERQPPAPIDMQLLEFIDFSGGMTDYYLGGPQNKYQKAENLLIVKHGGIGKLITRPGSETYVVEQIPAGSQRIGTLKYFSDKLLTHSARKLYYYTSSWQTLQGTTGNDLFPSGVDTTTVVSLATWNNHLFITNSDFSKLSKVYRDGSSNLQLRTAGLPAISAPTVTAGAAGANSYIYAFVRYFTYTVGTLVFEDRGPVTEVLLTSAEAPNVSAVAITNITALANGATLNYATASSDLKIEIYRTANGGVDFYKVGSVNNGTTTFNDSMSDATLVTQASLYTAGGVVENDDPPLAKLIHITQDKGYYAHVKIGTEIHANRYYQSIPGDIDAVPGDFYGEVDDEIVGLSSVKGIPVLLCKNSVWRSDGEFDFLGRGSLFPQRISDTASCVSSQSVVQTLDGVFWAGDDGFFFTDGYQVIRISEDIDKTYQDMVASAERKRRIQGKFDSRKRRIWWAVQYESDATDNDFCFIADLNWGISTNVPFTTASGASFAPTAIEFIGSDLIRADKRGYVLEHSDTVYTDPKIDTGVASTSWGTEAILYEHISIATNFGTTGVRKFVPRVNVICQDETNLSLQITSINDDGRREGLLKPVRSRGKLTWGEPDVYWGDPNILWNYAGLIDEWRRMPAENLRCEYKQIKLTNAFVAILTSEIIGTCVVDAGATTATLTDTATYDWPTNAVDYYIAFEVDGYTTEFLITARTGDVLTFADPSGLAVSASGVNWVIRGVPKGEIMNLSSYCMQYAIFGRTQATFTKSSTGEVGASSL